MTDGSRLPAPVAVLGSVACAGTWALLAYLQSVSNLPRFNLTPGWRWFFLILFGLDMLVSVLWSRQILRQQMHAGQQLVTTGPYAILRHPMYAAVLWNGTGLVAFGSGLWLVLFGVLPLHLCWTWLVAFEERDLIDRYGTEYQTYAAETGQFFPYLSTLKTLIKNGSNSGEVD